MTRPLMLDIGSVRIDAEGRPEDAARIEETLRAALNVLGDKLAASPYARDPRALGFAIEQMIIGDLSPDDWLGERGAHRVAEAMFAQIDAAGRTD